MPDGRYLVVTTYAGMSNRLRTLASAQIMASITDRKLVVDWPIKSEEMVAQWSDFFSNPMEMLEDSALARNGCTIEQIEGAKKENPFIKNLGIQNDSKTLNPLMNIPQYNEHIVYYGTTINFSPKEEDLPAAEYDKLYRNFYHNLIPKTYINKEVKKFKKEHNFDNYYMVGVHYREWKAGPADTHSALINDPTQRYIPDFAKEMKKALDLNASETKGKPVAFFLAAESEEVRKKLLAIPEFSDKIFYRTDEVERKTLRGQESALVDFFLLGSTNFIIGTFQSSFSDEAAYLTDAPKINVGSAAYR
jgi:hypothetical protein